MSGYYPPGHNLPPQYYNIDPNGLPSSNLHAGNAPPVLVPHGAFVPSIPENPFHPGTSGPFVQYADAHVQPPYIDQFDDLAGPLGAGQGASARNRRRPIAGEQVKHRRTRSGCFTCRQRRVKCDENHPTCERCRKGNRECVYPDTQTSQKGGRSSSKSGKPAAAEDASSPEEREDEVRERMASIPDEDEEEDEDDMDQNEDPMTKSQDLHDSPYTPSSTLENSVSPSTDASSVMPPAIRQNLSRKSSSLMNKPSAPLKSSTTARGVQFYLDYFRNHMSMHHYSLKCDGHNFLKGDFLALAMKFEPLKYAVAGYAAYFHTLQQPDGRISTFLQFYNESVSRLRVAITKNKKHGLATFSTILQLASIEEMLGDWVNLLSHQKAAFEMLTRLYTPKSITQSNFVLKLVVWYIRFDLFVGFQSQQEAVLTRDWYEAVHDYYVEKSRENPENLGYKYETRFAWSRLVARDMNDLFAQSGKGLVSPQQLMEEIPKLHATVDNLDQGFDPALTDPAFKIKDIPGEPNADAIVNPYENDVLFGKHLWYTNYVYVDAWGIMMMYHLSSSLALRKPFEPEVVKLAYRAVQIFESIYACPDAPPGAIIEAQTCWAIACLFLPKDTKTTDYCRRTFARIEAVGYIYPDTLRNRMLESMGASPSDFWLPNDEACPPIIRSIKDFIRERTMAPRDQVSDDLREMRGIFSSLTISDSPPSDTTVTAEGGAAVGAQANSVGERAAEGSPEWSGYSVPGGYPAQ